ncbi:Na+/H+ antiporter subunit A [Speluncibacter jeojiensis]|uniref:Na+/H+ antiporter subunit A n=1 Tax=Speluncibacter jeojiensis TaxID=2710754 RepID=A0A9X4M935_9ACTN|nr:Na+/H+ antiporter subunit A [Corynebacteriales bacterium D3-21]
MLAVLLAHAIAAVSAPMIMRVAGRNGFYLLALVPLAGLGWTIDAWGTEQRLTLDWVPGLSMNIALRFDSLAQILAVLVLAVGALVLVYCGRYFDEGSPRLGWFAAEMVAFAGTMFGLVLSDNMLLLYVFWELTTVLSFLLVGHYGERASSRRAATQALLVTTAGGLAMLVGIIMLGQMSGTYLLSDLVAHPPHGWLSATAIVLVLIGALSKSAIVPMHFWLPGAMAAPTPVSAYLHAAAMVKAGIFLVARLAPGFAESSPWRPLVLTLGIVSMILAGWRALREYDLKLILAFGTVSQLGFMMVLVGTGSHDAALAGVTIVVAHALFKSTLFMVVGVIDHSTGTRDVRKLAGLGRAHKGLTLIACAAAASMAGVPPFLGFVGKEAALESYLNTPVLDDLSRSLVFVGIVVGSIFTVAYTLRFLSGAFAGKGLDAPSKAVAEMHRPSPLFLAAPTILALAGLAAGLQAPRIGALLEPYAKTLPTGAGGGYHLALWHHVGPAMWITILVFIGGFALFFAHRAVARARFGNPPLGNADRAYDWALRAADSLSLRLTSTVQRGSLPLTQTIILTTLVVLSTMVLIFGATGPARLHLWGSPLEVAIGLLMLIPAVAATVLRNRLAAVLMVGFTGYGSGVIFALHGAPDLALTQFLVETLMLVIFVLVLRKLPADTNVRRAMGFRGWRIVLAALVGAALTTIGAYAINARNTQPVASVLPHAAYAVGHGKNVVNVLLVDIRAWDTFGEITVLLVAATGVASLVFRNRRFGSAPRVADAPDAAVEPPTVPLPATVPPTTPPAGSPVAVASDSHTDEDLVPNPAYRSPHGPITWLRGSELRDPRHRTLVLEVTTRVVFPTIMVLSVYFFFAGHNHPGGGFAGGLTAGLALVLRYLAGGRYELGETVPIDAGKILGLGLFCSAATATVSMLLGAPVLSSAVVEVTLPLLGHITVVTAMFFDLGVYLIVVGLVLDVLRSLGARLDSPVEVKLQ